MAPKRSEKLMGVLIIRVVIVVVDVIERDTKRDGDTQRLSLCLNELQVACISVCIC